MKAEEGIGNVLKEALARRQTRSLSSNFSFRMMELVHLETEKKYRRKERMGFAFLMIAVLALLGLGGYFLIFKMKFHLCDYILQAEYADSSSIWGFYGYIALLVLGLLGLDYWLRKKFISK